MTLDDSIQAFRFRVLREAEQSGNVSGRDAVGEVTRAWSSKDADC